MISEPFITEADIEKHLGWDKNKPKPNTVPTIRFDVPPITEADIVKSVGGNGGPWRSLQDVYRESIEEKRAKKLSDLYDRNEIPEPEFETREFGI